MKRAAIVAGVAAVQLALTGVAVAPQLSARVTGEKLLVRVAPVDPIDPFRGAYVDLDYPDLAAPEKRLGRPAGDLYVTLAEKDGVWVGTDWTRERPDDGTYIACRDNGWHLTCGIESLFTSQRRAKELENDLMRGGAIAEIRVDSRGNAAVLDIKAK